ncbi:DNA modification methylase [Halohasta litchfieldiae]|jgi:DNA modification methylase|uniref:Type II methyltransferase n=1 Tax=Halohasta litchfieldiae TaxID=1073996 RepID=A0A1H6VE88_9EURY|nr:site-specific DNA-methyltransferase [Halohasta litchfieldiae]ATW88958.1 DNA modification methylase [Halohasta litchfieldiae]SEJ01304.1 DNA modification methylase [Halohasta litchfieldiae]
METDHRVHIGDSRSLERLDSNSVDLVVTSPPYPMIEMWDDLFISLDSDIEGHLAAGRDRAAFEAMHTALDSVWEVLGEVLVDGGIACINVGDATRSVDGSFRRYQNHGRIVSAFDELGFEPLPSILWRKPTNSAAKFMGSGMLPPNAYATLEHEHVLVFRNGPNSRYFEPKADRRYTAAYFWEERNQWFSDLWTDITGRHQQLTGTEDRERSAAYPVAIPYRLINMYSVYGDTVFDPFWGTGTTTLAAMAAGRNSVGKELDPGFETEFRKRVDAIGDLTDRLVAERLTAHETFVAERQAEGKSIEYEADNYDFAVMTKQERPIQLFRVAGVDRDAMCYTVDHEPVGVDWREALGAVSEL